MKAYRIFGGRLRSSLDFPELPRIDAPLPDGDASRFDAVLRPTDGLPESTGELLGAESVEGAGRLRLYRSGGGLRLEHDRTGMYALAPDEQRIEWRASDPRPPRELVRSAVLTRVLPLLLHARGLFPLHASGVTTGDGSVVGFAAPKGHGKSTLALALATRGARLVSDDTLPVEPGSPPAAWPGDSHLKIWDDAAAAVGVDVPDRPALARLGPDQTRSGVEKHKFLITERDLPALEWEDEARPLEALYLLAPVGSDAGEPERGGGRGRGDAVLEPASPSGPERVRLPATDAAPVLVACSKVATLLHGSAGPDLLSRATRVADAVPVYAVPVPRDHGRLSALCDRMAEWHAPRTDESGRTAEVTR